MNGFRIAVIICIVFFLAFAFMPDFLKSKGQDFYFHFYKSKGECEKTYSPHGCGQYPALFSQIGGLFSTREELFYAFAISISAIFIPLALFFISREPFAPLFYFAFSSYFYTNAGTGQFPFALACLLALGIFVFKNNFIRIALLILSIAAHSHGLALVGATYFFVLLNEQFSLKFFQLCFPGFGGKIAEKIIGENFSKSLMQPILDRGLYSINLHNLLSFCVKMCPLPVFILGIREQLLKKRYDMLAMVGLAGLTSYFLGARILLVIPLFILPAFCWWYSRQPARIRKIVLGLAGLYLTFQIFQYFANVLDWFC